MKIQVYAAVHLPHHVERGDQFVRGLRRHGYQASLNSMNNVHPCDLAVFWGMHQTVKVRQVQEKYNNPWLMMERGYVGDRFHWTSLGYNGLNGKADFLNANKDDSRWNKHFGDSWLQDWHEGTYVLLAGQVLQDASIKHLGVDYQKIANDIKEHTNLPVYFRKHPHKLCKTMRTPHGCTTAPHNHIEDSLKKARVCVTVNSNSGVDAILAGTPVINLDRGSMVWDIAQHNYANIDNPPYPDRQQ